MPDGRIRVTYWEKWTGFEGDAMRRVVDLFNKSQNKIFVDLLTVSEIDRKVLVATAGGNPPDVAGLFSFNVIEYAEKNALIPLDKYCKAAGIGPEKYIPAYWRLCVHKMPEGNIWALPTTPATVALHWNKKMFRKAGLDPDRPPRTIKELDEYAEKLTIRDKNGHIVQMGFLPTEPGWWNWAWGYWFGGKLWDGKSKITTDSPENVRAYEWVRSYSKKYGIHAIETFQSGFGTFSSPQNAFLSGKVAMVLQGVWMYNFIKNYAPGMEWGAAPFPSADPSLKNVTVAEADVLCIPRDARHPDEAFEFMKFVNSQKAMELLCMGQRKFTPLRKVSKEFLENHPNPYIRMFINLAWSPNAVCTPRMGLWREYQDELNAAFDQIWLGEKTPRDALRDVRKRIQWKLDRELRRKARMKQ